MKKKFVLLMLVFLLALPSVSFGKERGKDEGPGDNVELGESVMVEGVLSEPTLSTTAVDTVVSVISGPSTVKKFVRYLTDSWAKASSYTWSKSNSASSTISSEVGATAGTISSKLGVSNTVTTTYSVAITIPADSSRYSKLAYYSDFDSRYVRVRLYNYDGICYSDKNTYHYGPRKDTYLQVVYQ